MNKYSNKKLEEFVKDRNEGKKITEHRGRLYQKMDPIFREPEGRFIKAHFYAPVKFLFGLKIDTFVMNIIVLWIMTLLFYIALYFRLLKKLLDSGELLMGKSGKSD
jgi:hypothetical protein